MKRSTDRIRRLGEIQSISRGRGHRDEEAVAVRTKRQAGLRKHVVLSPLFSHAPLRPNWDEAIDFICPEIISELEPFGCVCGALTPELAHSCGTRARWAEPENE
jgi:hypothetical protein